MNKNGSHAKNGKHHATPAFVVRAENNRLGLPLLVWSNGKTVLTKA